MTTTNTYSIHFETLGCKVNQIESESVARAFSDAGFVCSMGGLTSASKYNSDTILCILNTCTVTAKAEQKARRLMRLLLEKHPNACLLVTGCYAELEKALIEGIDKHIAVLRGTQKDLLVDLPKKIEDFLFDNSISDAFSLDLTQYISQYFNKTIEQFVQTNKPRSFVLSTDTFMQHSRSSIKIQDGCNSRCTYCRICLARGKSISLSASEILARIQKLEDSNHSEVTITGINLSQYHSNEMNFTNLLSYLIENTKKIQFRVSSLHPQVVTDELCSVLANSRVCPHFHLSIQSGSDDILQKMARPYKAEQIETAINRIRSVKENPFIACDIIVGFPGETEEDFMATRALCKKGNLTWIHAFPFSPRPDTAAFNMKPKVAKYVQQERVQVLTEIAIEHKRSYIESCVGKTYKGVVERFRKNDIYVVTENFLHVRIDSKEISIPTEDIGGKEVIVVINGSDKKDLRQAEGEAFGTIVSISE